MMISQGTSAQAKHATVKPAEEKRTTGNAQESANPGSSNDGKYVDFFFFIYIRFLSVNIM